MSGLIERPVFKEKYENYINGKFVAPIKGNYFDNKSPIDGSQIASMPLATAEDESIVIKQKVGEKKEFFVCRIRRISKTR